jgi:NitT/TauT family transport system ATP-binding protein
MQPSGFPAVAIDGVTLNYFTPERETLALSNVSLHVAKGEFVAIVGSSGCGKSTLLTLVSGLLAPSSGSIKVDGLAVTAPSPRVGYMFQKDTLLEWRSIIDNVLIGAEFLGLDKRRARKRAEGLLTRYGLAEFMQSLPSQLSGGMRQRAALACCSTSRFPRSTIRRAWRCPTRSPPFSPPKTRPSCWSRTTSAKPSAWPTASSS